MPIKPIVLQRRHAELGRIRLGHKAETQRGGTRPAKLDKFRFTSVSERYITDLAALYGGQAKPWDNGGVPTWEVYTDATTIPVIAVKGGMSQWLEFWSGGGCIHRCDGETNVLTGEPCDLDEQVKSGRQTVNPHTEAKPTTRLSVMLPELEAIGVWRLETHGWNAAAELPSMAELAMHVGDLVPATLYLAERSSIIQTSKGPQTSRYVVPGLDLAVTKGRLVELVGGAGGMAALEGASNALQIEAALDDDDVDAIADATTKDELNAIWVKARDAGRLTEALKARIIEAGAQIDARADESAEPIEGEVEDAPTPAPAIKWQDVVGAAGEQGITTSRLAEMAEERYAVPVADLDDWQLGELMAAITSGQAA